MEDMKEFIAYSRKLLRQLQKLKTLLDENEVEQAKKLVNELLEDTEKDIEA